MAFITLTEYAKRNGKDQGNVSRKFKNGDFKTAFRHGKIVLIDEDEPWSDRRLVNGRYVDFRKNLKVGKPEKSESQKFWEVSENGEVSGSD